MIQMMMNSLKELSYLNVRVFLSTGMVLTALYQSRIRTTKSPSRLPHTATFFNTTTLLLSRLLTHHPIPFRPTHCSVYSSAHPHQKKKREKKKKILRRRSPSERIQKEPVCLQLFTAPSLTISSGSYLSHHILTTCYASPNHPYAMFTENKKTKQKIW